MTAPIRKHQLDLFPAAPRPAAAALRAISTPEIDRLIAESAPVAIGVSGGKDSQAAALATFEHLDAAGHAGGRLLVHSDLGVVEWDASLPTCRVLADHLGTELLVLRRAAGDMMDRWEARWQSSRRRYAELSTVTLVPCWSTPAMRFCTSELKTQPITAALKRRFPGRTIVNVTGLRRQESAARARKPIASPAEGGRIWAWRPISDWSTDEVFAFIAHRGLRAHPAYAEYGMSRVSCRFCIMSNAADLAAAAAVAEAHGIYRRMVALEIASTFAFQGARWLGDVAPHLLPPEMRAQLQDAKARAARRRELEARILPGMLYVKGWPTRMLTDGEADILAEVRTAIADLIGIEAGCLDRESIHNRYAELIAASAARGAA